MHIISKIKMLLKKKEKEEINRCTIEKVAMGSSMTYNKSTYVAFEIGSDEPFI